jgi:hypothetical protein
MSTAFEKYSDILYSSYVFSSKQNEIKTKKKEILDEIIDFYNLTPLTILFVGFSPCLDLFPKHSVYVTEVSEEVKDYVQNNNLALHIDRTQIKPKQFDLVIAMDEYLTFASSDDHQKDLINFLANITQQCLITTLRDYKNQDFKNREFSYPIVVRGDTKRIYFEHYDYTFNDRNSCNATSYIIDDNGTDIIGPFDRRNLFFKQLAKFCLDAGASNFQIHKNLMHKSIIKKNYEHIITIRF